MTRDATDTDLYDSPVRTRAGPAPTVRRRTRIGRARVVLAARARSAATALLVDLGPTVRLPPPPRARRPAAHRHRSRNRAPLAWRPAARGSSAPSRGAARLRAPARPAGAVGGHPPAGAATRPTASARWSSNPGGPGASGIGIVRGGFGVDPGLGPGLADRFDIVSWDTARHRRQPAAWRADRERRRSSTCRPIPPTPPRRRCWTTGPSAVAAGLRAHAGPLLGHVDTATTARDLEQLRRALGGAKLTYAGYSYGTAIGLAYAGSLPDPHPGHGPRRRRRSDRRPARTCSPRRPSPWSSRSSTSSTRCHTDGRCPLTRSVRHLRPRWPRHWPASASRPDRPPSGRPIWPPPPSSPPTTPISDGRS